LSQEFVLEIINVPINVAEATVDLHESGVDCSRKILQPKIIHHYAHHYSKSW